MNYNKQKLPVVSVITVSYNSIDNLKVSLGSLKSQDYPFIESIIIDGGSSDGSREYISGFANEFEDKSEGFERNCKWVSESDNGLYFAVNKGIGLATGDIIGCFWDMYASEHVISDMVDSIIRDDTDGVHGDLLYVDKRGNTVRKWHMGRGSIRGGWMPGHPTLYLRRNVYDRYGVYNTDYKIAADFEFMVRCLKDDAIILSYIPDVLVKMFYGGASNSSISAYFNSIRESYHALRMNEVKPAGWIVFLRILRTVIQFRSS